ncbi:MAG TPA: hypothetical protein VK458_17030, partial [Myxococcaceae bacterium]|nr:hypothetical protein [Myxococcaceae bacterium]
MTERARELLEAELAHVHFLLDEVKRWDVLEVPPKARRYLIDRYERQSRVILSVLAEGSSPVAAVQEAVAAEPVAPVEVAAAPVVPVEAPAPYVEEPAAPAQDSVEEEPTEARNPHSVPLPEREEMLPPVVTEPLFDVPPPPQSIAARIVEETSTWDRIWRPFLYESIGWFVGA